MNRGEVAAAMGVSLPTLDKWVKDGCPIEVRGRKGVAAQFILGDVIAWWGARERSIAAGDGPADEEQLKKRKLAAEAGLAELEFAHKRGEVAPIQEFERAQAKMMAAIRANVMNIPSRAVLQLLGEKDETTFKRILRAECTLALEQSAQADFELDDDEADDEGEVE